MSDFETRKQELLDKDKDDLVSTVLGLEYDLAWAEVFNASEEEARFFKRLRENEDDYLISNHGCLVASNLEAFNEDLISNFDRETGEKPDDLDFLENYESTLFSYQLLKLVFKYAEEIKPDNVLIRYSENSDYPIHFVLSKDQENSGEFVVAPRVNDGVKRNVEKTIEAFSIKEGDG